MSHRPPVRPGAARIKKPCESTHAGSGENASGVLGRAVPVVAEGLRQRVCRPCFGAGAEYVRNGRVAGPAPTRAREGCAPPVEGTSTYAVELRRSRAACEAAAPASTSGPTGGASTSGPPSSRPSAPAPWRASGPERPAPSEPRCPDDEQFDASGDLLVLRRPPRPRRRGEGPTPTGRPAWTALFDQTAPAGRTTVGPAAPRADRDLCCVLDAEALRGDGRIQLRLHERTRRRDGKEGPLRAAHLARAEIAALPDPHDRVALALLMEVEGWSGPASTTGRAGPRP